MPTMATTLDAAAIRSLSSTQLSTYLRDAINHHGSSNVSSSLWHLVQHGSIPPDALHIFFSICPDPEPIVEAINQNVSAMARKSAIRHFGRWTKTEDKCPRIWDALGGTQGLLDLMARLSVSDVEHVCRAIQQNTKSAEYQQARQQKMTELYTSLMSSSAQASGQEPPFQNPDSRPLHSMYQHIAPACSAELVLRITAKDSNPNAALVKAHTPDFRQSALDAIFATPLNPKKHVSDYAYVLDTNINFSFEVFEKLSNSPVHLEHNAKYMMWSLIVPLASRLANRKAKQPVQLRLYNLVLKCAKLSSAFTDTIGMPILRTAIGAWRLCRRAENPMDEILGKLISLAPNDRFSSIHLITRELRRVAPPSRLPLLKIILRNDRVFELDLDVEPKESQKKMAEIDLKWSIELFYLLPSRASFKLFQQVQASNASGEQFYYDRYGSAVHSDPEEEDSNALDIEALASLLSARASYQNDVESAHPESAQKALEYRKKKAGLGREPEVRAKWAKSALLLSAATSSPEVYASTLQWARRFNRDPLVVWDLLNDVTLRNNEASSLLSGVPQHQFFAERHRQTVRDDVSRANQVIISLIENVSTISREPGFQLYKATAVLDLPGAVVQERCRRACSLVEQRVMDEDWVGKHIWDPTLKLLLDVEQYLLADGREALNRAHLSGPMKGNSMTFTAKHVRVFLDHLAQKRDEIWIAHRKKHRPATITLPAPWPQGLPIAKLCPVPADDQAYDADSVMPYLKSRAEAVVFMDSASALSKPPREKEDLEAIGYLVDSYSFALKFYIHSGGKDERKARIIKAWKHALGKLTSNELSTSDAEIHWKRMFTKSGIELTDLPVPSIHETFPFKFPDVDDPAVPAAWVPQDELPLSRDLTTTSLDCMHSAAYDTFMGWGNEEYSTTSGPKLSIPKTTFHPESVSMWTAYAFPSLLPVKDRDALAVAAIDLLNTKLGTHTLSLMKPYPSAQDVRVPAIYLDEEFLERETRVMNHGYPSRLSEILQMIDSLSSHIPNALLLELAKSLLDRLEKDEREDTIDPNVRQATLSVINLIARGEQPATVCGLVQHIILERPDDSSWHRQVLGEGFLEHLSAEEAQEFFSGLSEGVENKLQLARQLAAQKSATPVDVKMVDSSSLKPPAPSKPTVKITTVKMIAQALRYARFVSRSFGLEKLTSLLRNSVHPDVITCIVESLLELRDETDEQSLKDAVLDIIAENIVPLAASLTERGALSEDQWQALEAGEGDLPEHYDINCQQNPPLFDRLAAAAGYRSREEDAPNREEWMNRVILPIIHLSTENQRRWNKLFLQRNDLPLHVFDVLPPVPARIKMLLDVFQYCPQYLPVESMDVVEGLFKILETPPQILREVCNTIKKTTPLKKSPAGKYWLETWQKTDGQAQSGGYAHYHAMSIFINHLRTIDPGSARDGLAGINIGRIQRLVVSQARRYVRQNKSSQLDQLVSKLRFGAASGVSKEAQAERRRWERNYRPVLKSIINYIKSLRTYTWEHDPLRQPESLPSTQRLEIEIFSHTHRRSSVEQVGHNEYKACFTDLMKMLEDLIALTPLHDNSSQFQAIRGVAQQVYEGSHCLVLALWLGQLSGNTAPGVAKSLEMRTKDYLRVDIAQDLLHIIFRNAQSCTQGWDMLAWNPIETVNLVPAGAKAGGAREPYSLAVAMVNTWLASPEEFIRRQATKFYSVIDAVDLKRVPGMEHNPLWIAFRHSAQERKELIREKMRSAQVEEKLEDDDFELEDQVSSIIHDGDVVMADREGEGAVSVQSNGQIRPARKSEEELDQEMREYFDIVYGDGGRRNAMNRGRGRGVRGSMRGSMRRGSMRGVTRSRAGGRGAASVAGWPYSFERGSGFGRGRGRGG